MRLLPALAASAAALALSVSGSVGDATAAPEVRVGIQDDAWLEFGPGTLAARVERLSALGVDEVRVTLNWSRIEPKEGERSWASTDAILEALRDKGLAPLVTLWGAPGWANGERPSNYAPASGTSFAAFARAAAERYPWVRDWLVWNEPNQRRWLRPASPAVYVTRLLNPAYTAIKQVIPPARVAGGATAPRGSVGGVSPVDFIRGMAKAKARLDAYAHHPYPLSRLESPTSGGCAHCETITMATLDRLLTETALAFGPRTRIWLTELGYQTRPPDTLLGVPLATQARYLAEAARRAYAAPRVDLVVQYLVRDEPDVGRWQSGLETVDGRPKPALDAFRLPFVQVSRQGLDTVVWGQVRPGSGARRYAVLQRVGSGWRTVAAGVTNARGVLNEAVQAGRGARLRLLDRSTGAVSPTLIVR